MLVGHWKPRHNLLKCHSSPRRIYHHNTCRVRKHFHLFASFFSPSIRYLNNMASAWRGDVSFQAWSNLSPVPLLSSVWMKISQLSGRSRLPDFHLEKNERSRKMLRSACCQTRGEYSCIPETHQAHHLHLPVSLLSSA